MIPSKFGFGPLSTASLADPSSSSILDQNDALFAMPDNSSSNSEYLNLLTRTADQIMDIQRDQENTIKTKGMPRLCFVSFKPQRNEDYLIPITKYLLMSNKKNTAIASFFTVPNDIYKIYFECEDPNILQYMLKSVPELATLKISVSVMTDNTEFVKNFCNLNTYSLFQVGFFVIIDSPEFFNDIAQIVSVDKDAKKCMLKIIPRIDYENLKIYNSPTQMQLNYQMPPDYQPPKALYDKSRLSNLNDNIRISTKKIHVDSQTEITVDIWSGMKFYGKFLYKVYPFYTLKTIIKENSIDESEFNMFKNNIFGHEQFLNGFQENMIKFINRRKNRSLSKTSKSFNAVNDYDDVKNRNKTEISKDTRKETISGNERDTNNNTEIDDILSNESKISSEPEKNKQQMTKHKKKKKCYFPIFDEKEQTPTSPDPSTVSPQPLAPTTKSEVKVENIGKHDKIDIVKTEKDVKIEKVDEDGKFEKKKDKKEKKDDKLYITHYGPFSGIPMKIISKGDIYTAQIYSEPLISIPFNDFVLEELKYEAPKEYADSEVQAVKEKPLKDQSTTKKSEKYVEEEVQLEANRVIIPKVDDLVVKSNRHKAVVLENNGLFDLSTGITEKIDDLKGSFLQLRVVEDDNFETDYKGQRLSPGEYVKVVKGANNGLYLQICHIASEFLFVKNGNTPLRISPNHVEKVSEEEFKNSRIKAHEKHSKHLKKHMPPPPAPVPHSNTKKHKNLKMPM